MNGNITVAGQQILLPMIRKVYPGIVASQIMGVQLMSKPKYKFSRAKWYTADLMTMNQDLFKVHEWCTEQFGPHDRYPNAWSRWVGGIMGNIKFRDEKDYQWFILKWSGNVG